MAVAMIGPAFVEGSRYFTPAVLSAAALGCTAYLIVPIIRAFRLYGVSNFELAGSGEHLQHPAH